MNESPYRLAVVEQPRPLAYCPWCRWSSSFNLFCVAPGRNPSGNNSALTTESANPKGECAAFQVSWWTRLLRRFGWRMP